MTPQTTATAPAPAPATATAPATAPAPVPATITIVEKPRLKRHKQPKFEDLDVAPDFLVSYDLIIPSSR